MLNLNNWNLKLEFRIRFAIILPKLFALKYALLKVLKQ